MPASRTSTARPTNGELAIMHVLWRRGASSVREVLEDINAKRPVPLAYTTVLRFLQIMMEKSLACAPRR